MGVGSRLQSAGINNLAFADHIVRKYQYGRYWSVITPLILFRKPYKKQVLRINRIFKRVFLSSFYQFTEKIRRYNNIFLTKTISQTIKQLANTVSESRSDSIIKESNRFFVLEKQLKPENDYATPVSFFFKQFAPAGNRNSTIVNPFRSETLSLQPRKTGENTRQEKPIDYLLHPPVTTQEINNNLVSLLKITHHLTEKSDGPKKYVTIKTEQFSGDQVFVHSGLQVRKSVNSLIRKTMMRHHRTINPRVSKSLNLLFNKIGMILQSASIQHPVNSIAGKEKISFFYDFFTNLLSKQYPSTSAGLPVVSSLPFQFQDSGSTKSVLTSIFNSPHKMRSAATSLFSLIQDRWNLKVDDKKRSAPISSLIQDRWNLKIDDKKRSAPISSLIQDRWNLRVDDKKRSAPISSLIQDRLNLKVDDNKHTTSILNRFQNKRSIIIHQPETLSTPATTGTRVKQSPTPKAGITQQQSVMRIQSNLTNLIKIVSEPSAKKRYRSNLLQKSEPVGNTVLHQEKEIHGHQAKVNSDVTGNLPIEKSDTYFHRQIGNRFLKKRFSTVTQQVSSHEGRVTRRMSIQAQWHKSNLTRTFQFRYDDPLSVIRTSLKGAGFGRGMTSEGRGSSVELQSPFLKPDTSRMNASDHVAAQKLQYQKNFEKQKDLIFQKTGNRESTDHKHQESEATIQQPNRDVITEEPVLEPLEKLTNKDIHAITDRVMGLLEKRISIEKDRRGIL